MPDLTPQDARIRALVVELSESSPMAPTAQELGLAATPATGTLPSYTEVTSIVEKDERKGRKFFGGLAAAAALLAGGSIAFTVAGSGGAAAPEAAVEQLFEAMQAEDALGIIESIDPDERQMLLPIVTNAVGELDRMGVLGGEAQATELGDVAGFDFAYEGLELTSRDLGEGIKAVRVASGTFSSTTDSAALPIGGGVYELVGDSDEVEMNLSRFAIDVDDFVASWPELFADNDFEIVVTESDGWHVDIGHTFMEAIRKENQWPAPDYAALPTPTGAVSPEQAANEWLAAQGAFDVREIVNLLDPVEMPAVHLYGEQIASTLDELMGSDGFYFGTGYQLTSSSSRVEGEGSSRSVVFDQYVLARTTGDPDFFDQGATFTFDGRCVTQDFEGEGQVEPVCSDDADTEPWLVDIIEALPIEIRVVERDGAWFVSPLGTIDDQVVNGLGSRDVLGDSQEAGWSLLGTMYEAPVLPFFGPGQAINFFGISSFGEEGFSDVAPEPAFGECYEEVVPPFGERLSQTEAAAAADALASCFVANEIASDFARQEVAAIACSYIGWDGDGVPDPAEADALLGTLESCLETRDAPPANVERVAYETCSAPFEALYATELEPPAEGGIAVELGRPSAEAEFEAYQQQAACLISFGISESYQPTLEELQQQRVCDEIYESAEATSSDSADYEALDDEYQTCMNEVFGE